jgi:MFS family permease
MRICLLAVLTFILFLSTQIGVPTLPRLSAELGAGQQETALVLSAALMTLVALQFVSGILADRFGRRTVLIGGAALGGATSLLCALASHWQALFALRVVGGAADAIAMPALLGLTAEMAQGRRGTFFGVLRGSQGLSFIVAPSIGGWLSLYSLRAPFVVDGLLSFAACGVLFAFVGAGRVESEHRLDLREWTAVFSQWQTWAFALFAAVNNFAFPILAAFLPVKALAMGFEAWQIAVLLAMEALGFTVASFLVGRFSDRVGRRPFVLIAQPLVFLSCAGLYFSRDLVSMVVWYTLFGLAGGTTFLLGLVMMSDVTPNERAATVLGIFDATIDLVILIAPLVAIAVSGWIGSEGVLALAGLPALLAFAVALRVRETRARPEGFASPGNLRQLVG